MQRSLRRFFAETISSLIAKAMNRIPAVRPYDLILIGVDNKQHSFPGSSPGRCGYQALIQGKETAGISKEWYCNQPA
jgi:hypothetical protein